MEPSAIDNFKALVNPNLMIIEKILVITPPLNYIDLKHTYVFSKFQISRSDNPKTNISLVNKKGFKSPFMLLVMKLTSCRYDYFDMMPIFF